MGRSPCCSKEGLNKGAWTACEDKILRDYITNHGDGSWRNLPKRAGLKRCGKSCRLRWLNYLRPDIKRGNISPDEEELIIRLHKLLGNRWSLIAGRLPGRTDNEIKNYWNTNLGKKVHHHHHQHTTTTSTSTPHHQQYPNQSPNDHSSHSPLIKMGSHQVIRTKAIKCSKVFLNLDAATSSSSSVDNHNKPIQSDHTYSSINHPSDFMMDFNLEDFSLSDFLNSDFSGLCGFNSSSTSDHYRIQLSPASDDNQPDLEYPEEMLQDGFLTGDNESDPENVASYLDSIASFFD